MCLFTDFCIQRGDDRGCLQVLCRSASDDARFGLLSNLVMVLVMKQSFEYGTPNEVYNDRRIEIDF